MGDAFFESWSSLGRTALSGAIAYVILIAMLRIAGKRTLAKLNAFDFVVTIALGSTLASVLTSSSLPLANGILALALLVALQYVVASGARASRPFEEALKSRPRAVFREGEFDDDAIARERLTRDEVRAAIRKKGIGSLDHVSVVILETDGSMSVITGAVGTGSRSALKEVEGSGENEGRP